jgi:hypothetical protein
MSREGVIKFATYFVNYPSNLIPLPLQTGYDGPHYVELDPTMNIRLVMVLACVPILPQLTHHLHVMSIEGMVL